MTWFLDTSAMQPAPCGTSKKSQLLQKTYAAIPGSLAYLHIDIHIMIDLHTREGGGQGSCRAESRGCQGRTGLGQLPQALSHAAQTW